MLNSKYNVKQKGGSSERVEKIVYGLLKKNVKLLALDFDQTLVDIFMSTYQSSPSLIAQHIRPVFVSLINACMAKNIVVAIVTFSSNTELIAKAMETKLDICISPEYGRLKRDEILLRGLDDTWSKPNSQVLPNCWQNLRRRDRGGVPRERQQRCLQCQPVRPTLVDDDAEEVE